MMHVIKVHNSGMKVGKGCCKTCGRQAYASSNEMHALSNFLLLVGLLCETKLRKQYYYHERFLCSVFSVYSKCAGFGGYTHVQLTQIQLNSISSPRTVSLHIYL